MDDQEMSVVGITSPTRYPSVAATNVFLLRGHPVTLVDVGPDNEEALDLLEDGLARWGLHVSDVEAIFLTHPHWDHFGLAHRIVDASGAKIYAHPASGKIVENLPAYWDEWLKTMQSVMRMMGVPHQLIEENVRYIKSAEGYAQPVKVDRLVNGGDVLELGGTAWQVLDTPGHSPGGICLYSQETGNLLTGDTLLDRIFPVPVLEPPEFVEENWKEAITFYLGSLEKLATLGDQVKVWPGHGRAFNGARQGAKRNINYCHQRREQVLRILAARGIATGWEICSELFPNIHPANLFMGICETWGYLWLLAEANEIAYQKRDDILLFEIQ